jgi:hypothetical protein
MQSPVIVWTMGKVGSLSVYHAIRAAKLRALHPHYCDAASLRHLREKFGRDLPVIKHGMDAAEVIERATPENPALIVTMVRTPIERNISSYFHNRGFLNISTNDLGENIRLFIDTYSHHVVLKWLDLNLKKVLDLDVYAEPFDKEKGFRIYDRGRHKVLLLRSDLSRGDQGAIVSDFLGRPITIGDRNVAGEKAYADDYQAFVDRIDLSKEFVDGMLNSAYAQHFWQKEKLDQLRKFWLREYAAVD